MPPSSSRTPLIDMVKALACIAIVWHHLAFYGPMSDIAQPLAPALMSWLYDHARIAVQVFLVVGGYLAAGSLAPQGVARFAHWGGTVGKRFVRLVVPYAVALVLTVAVSAIVRPWFDHPSVSDEPTFAQLLTNALLLQDVLGEDALSAGVWYVAIDFQLFALSALIWSAVRMLPGPTAVRYAALLGQGLVVAGTAASLWVFNRMSGLDMWALYFFGAYGLGMLAFWAVHAPRARGWVALMLLLGGVALFIDYRSRILVALLTALAMVWALRSEAVRNWQGVRPLVLLGQMSYSVFLVHFAVCMLVNAVVGTLWPASPVLNAMGMGLAFVLSLATGRVLYLRVERHVPTWRTALRWQCGLIGAGLLLALPAQWV
ncbi:MAG: acyltransferase [Acidovorax sp.]|jgi:peptidoglycan/LPS O-acetylase OafA/YrhL|uniref:acyltransferase family protein n=1 Tax=Acidovorax sp. TaxID=1872122 RepID=UPI00261EE135|nr:acyltransferase [Acidovorax sp.]MDH4464726.1 acyltransferase [Acidovorax sp.]